MKMSQFFRSTVLTLAVSSTFYAPMVMADTLEINQDPNAFGFTVTASGQSHSGAAGFFNVLNAGNSFIAFCYELLGPVAPSFSYTATQAGLGADVQKLFNQSYAGLDFSATNTFDDLKKIAGFQIAIWETQDDKNLGTGNFTNWATDAAVKSYAESFLLAVSNPLTPNTGSYDLKVWVDAAEGGRDNKQNLIQATQGSGQSVPEPATALLCALGLFGMAALRRRKV